MSDDVLPSVRMMIGVREREKVVGASNPLPFTVIPTFWTFTFRFLPAMPGFVSRRRTWCLSEPEYILWLHGTDGKRR